MPIEIEAKMAVANTDALVRKLAQLNAQDLGSVHEVNTFFDNAETGLLADDRALRLRVRTDPSGRCEAIVTYKGPRTQGLVKSRSETECQIGSAQAMAEIFESLGYRVRLCFHKQRRSFRLDGCAVDIDTLPHLGSFVQIEGPTETQILAIRTRLNLDDSPLVRSSYAAMLTTYVTEHDLRTDIIRFDNDSPRPPELLVEAS